MAQGEPGERGQIGDPRAAGKHQEFERGEREQRTQVVHGGVVAQDQLGQGPRSDTGDEVLEREVVVDVEPGPVGQASRGIPLVRVLHEQVDALWVDVGEDLVRVLLRVEPVPGAHQLTPYVQCGMRAEPLQNRECAFPPKAGRGDHHRVRLLVAQPLRPRQQFQHERTRLGELLRLELVARRYQPRRPRPHLLHHLLVDGGRVLEAGQGQEGEAGDVRRQ